MLVDSLIKLLRRREFDFLEARITTLRAKFAEDGIELAPAPADVLAAAPTSGRLDVQVVA